MEIIPSLIRRFRKGNGWTTAELARRAGVSRSVIVRLEGGENAPRWDTLVGILEQLNVPVWRAIAVEYAPEVITELRDAVVKRFRSGKWRRQPGKPELLGGFEDKLADFILRDLDSVMGGKMESLSELPVLEEEEASEPDVAHLVHGWTGSEVEEMIQTVTSRIPPTGLNALLALIEAGHELPKNEVRT